MHGRRPRICWQSRVPFYERNNQWSLTIARLYAARAGLKGAGLMIFASYALPVAPVELRDTIHTTRRPAPLFEIVCGLVAPVVRPETVP
jgi:hypothetical protein